MTQKLIKINTDHYVVVDDSEIKEGDFVLHPNGTIGTIKIALAIAMVEGTNEGSYVEDCKNITHSTLPLEQYYGATDGTIPFVYHKINPLSLCEVKELLGEVDVEKKAESRFGTDIGSIRGSKEYDLNTDLKRGFVKGYNQALKDNKEKKYTEEDLRKSYLEGKSYVADTPPYFDNFEQFIQSLQPKTEWEVEIVDGKLKLV